MLRRSPSRWPVGGLVAIGLLAGLGLAVWLARPRVVAFTPTPASAYISARTPLRLTFNRSMDQAATARGLRLNPSVPGQITWEARTLVFTPQQPWPREVAVEVTLAEGRSSLGLPLWGGSTWRFTVSRARLAYLTGALANLWLLDTDDPTQPVPVTREPYGVYDFDISPDGVRFVYAALRADGGADLRLINVDGSGQSDLLACPESTCLSPAFSPDGRWVAYERHSRLAGAGGDVTSDAGRVYLLALATGETAPLGEADASARFPRWGPDGRLGYYDANRQALVVYDPRIGQVSYVPNTSGDLGSWSPDGQSLVFAEIFFPPEPTVDPARPSGEHFDRFYSHLLKVNLATNAVENLSGGGVVEDASPVYSPSGAWIAFARRGLTPDQWTPGRQLWLMRADGSQAYPLSAEPVYTHSAFRWSPDERALVYMRFNAAEPVEPAEIWMINVDGSGARQLAVGGYLPEWLP